MMKNENIVRRLELLVAEANELAEGKSTVEIDEDPHLAALMAETEPIIEELDAIVNNAFPNHPEKVAHWRKAMGIEEE
jgi:hypothetical protein